MSLLGCDMFYRIHRRMVEIFQCDDLLANKSALLVGDLLQLPPVKATYIFDHPKSQHFRSLHKETPLWKSFTPVVLKKNHRQKEEKLWADTLNRFRKGIVTQEDENLLKSRLTTEEFLDHDALHVFYTNAEVADHNNKMLNKLDTQMISNNAIKSGPKGYKPWITPHGTVDDTQMMDVLVLKIGSRVKLTVNVRTCDELVNGAMGTVVGFEHAGEHLEFVIVAFDQPSCGEQQRQEFHWVSSKYEKDNGTPITRHELEHLPKGYKGHNLPIRCKVLQFPLKLCWGSTAHSMQGVTVKSGSKLIVHWNKRLIDGMAYVMLGRCERLEDIYICGDLNTGKIRVNTAALEESERLEQLYNSRMLERSHLDACLKVSYLNVRSVLAHLEDIKKSPILMSSTVLGFGETWLEQDTTVDLPGFHGIFENVGRGKGICAFSKQVLLFSKVSDEGLSAIKLNIHSIEIIFLYLSQGVEWLKVKDVLNSWINPSCPTLIMGDMNWHWCPDSNHPMKTYLQSKGLKQLLRESTHDLGHCLDHIYINGHLEQMEHIIETQSPYHSDHDILTMYFPNVPSQ